MKGKVNFWAILVFYIIAISSRFLTTKTDILKNIFNSYFEVLLNGVGPALGALVVFKLFQIKPTLTLKGNYKKVLIPIVLYWFLPIILISTVSYLSKGVFSWTGILIILIYGLLEEVGWRGFLYQHLKSIPLTYNILIVSTLWFLWHLNFDLTTSNLLFYGIIILGSWGIGKVANLTSSLFAISAFHSLYNFFPNINNIKLIIIVVLLMIWIGGLIIRKKSQNSTINNTTINK